MKSQRQAKIKQQSLSFFPHFSHSSLSLFPLAKENSQHQRKQTKKQKQKYREDIYISLGFEDSVHKAYIRQQGLSFLLNSRSVVLYLINVFEKKAKTYLNLGDALLSDKARYSIWQFSNRNGFAVCNPKLQDLRSNVL